MFGDLFKRLKHFDAYPKPLEDFRVKTLSGGIISVFCTITIIALFLMEWRSYLAVDIDQELFVDLTRNQKLTINLNMTFTHLPCALLSIDVMDVSGEHQLDVVKGVKKVRLNTEGRIIIELNKTESETLETTIQTPIAVNETALDMPRCLSCYGAEASNFKCCNTCDDVRSAYRQKNWHFSPFGVEQCQKEFSAGNMQASSATRDKEYVEKMLKSGEGCQLAGHLEVNKVAGNFHIAPGVSYQQEHMHFHDIKHLPIESFNTNHYFEMFSFGDEYPNQFNPLERKSLRKSPPTSITDLKRDSSNSDEDENASAAPDDNFLKGFLNFGLFGVFMQVENNEPTTSTNTVSYNYFLKIVPTTYEYLDGRIVNNTYQYSVTRSAKKITSQSVMSSQLPGIFISYEIAPIMVKFVEKSKSFSHFLTSCCAIIGGLFTVAGMLDAAVFRYYNMYKKYQMNKLT